ncbi:innexin inx1-like [Oppia nitens]|uniref:innexin inx1-like n=1 Tax=Oppia nitens TaxID=1686743 RepID=UPI0023DB7F65|nr:innexin inx1-like [Oppia nitens]
MCFRIHYKTTVSLLVCLAIIVIIYEYQNDAIDCLSNDPQKYSTNLLNTICWTQESFEVIDSLNLFINNTNRLTNTKLRSNSYVNNFHWIGFLFSMQALCFYIPHWLWSSMENNKLNTLLSTLMDNKIPEEKKLLQLNSCVRYLLKHMSNHDIYAIKYMSTKMICLLNLIIQIVISNVFLSGHFTGLGFYLLFNLQNSDHKSILSDVFPRTAICRQNRLEINDLNNEILCLLPINLIIEKLFLFQWFWFCILLIIIKILSTIKYCTHL